MTGNGKSSNLLDPLILYAEEPERRVTILDTTLRDGSYAIDFKFSLDETRLIASALENAGIKQIEVGHGWGLNAESAGLGKAAHTDEEYITATRQALKKAKFGCFFIPGVARAGDLVKARDLGMDFVRIGNNITEYKLQENYINVAKNLGFNVSSNLLKSYVVSPKEFAERAKDVGEMGADVVVLVDSAGGMTPTEVKRYVRDAKRLTRVPLGFHGHDNLGLANANALSAVEEGATVIDATLQGIGRSAGNSITESLTLLLDKGGWITEIDPYSLFDAGERFIRPLLLNNGGYDPVDFILGVEKFHSSFVPMIKKIASEYGLDYRRLISEIAKVDRIRPTPELMREVAERFLTSKIILPLEDIENPDEPIERFA